MAVDPDLFAKFDKALGATAELAASEAQAAFEGAKAAVGAGNASEHAAAVALDKALVRIKNRYGDAAMQAAREFYAKQRDLAEVAKAFGEYEPEFADRIPDAFVTQDLTESVATQRKAEPEAPLDFDALCESMRGKVMEYPVKASDWTMTMNARRDPAHPKWAFVAHAGACPWCVMISSNGFRFASEAKAAAERHKHCTCPVVVDFDVDNPSLVGYDPDGMYERLHRCGEQIGSNDWADILKEAGNRDREWLRTGTLPRISMEPGARPLKKERDVAACLLSHGYTVRFMKEVNKTGIKTPDAFLGHEQWEFKVPEGWNGEHTIRNQFFKAKGKGTGRLLISGTVNGAPIEEMERWAAVTFSKGDYRYISEVMLLSPDGERLRILKRWGAQTPVP